MSRSGLTFLFERTTGDQPRLRDRHTGSPLIELLPNRQDAEKQIERLVFAPVARSYEVDAWVAPSSDARDPELDRLAGLDSQWAFDSSSRFHNLPRHRASSAFDGRPDTAWVSIWEPPSAPDPWISWEGAGATTVSRLTLTPPAEVMRRPTRVRVSGGGTTSPPLEVGPGGEVVLPEPIRARRLRLTVLKARFPAGTTRSQRTTRAIGIGSLEVPGVDPVEVPTEGLLRAGCGSVRVSAGGTEVALRPRGTVADLDDGRPLRATACDGAVRMGDDVQRIRTLPGVFSVDLLRLSSAAPAPQPRPAGGGEVVDSGRLGNSSLDGVTVDLDGPAWLTLGQSYSKGWRATCDGRSLGASRPMNGYANGWLAPADCRRVAFAFAPQETARLGYVISAVVCLLLAVFLVAGGLASRARERDTAAPPPVSAGRATGMPLPRAAAIALALTVPLALLFALRTSVFIFPALTFILWRGVGARVLIAIAVALLGIVVPAPLRRRIAAEPRGLQLRVQRRADPRALGGGPGPRPARGRVLAHALRRSRRPPGRGSARRPLDLHEKDGPGRVEQEVVGRPPHLVGGDLAPVRSQGPSPHGGGPGHRQGAGAKRLVEAGVIADRHGDHQPAARLHQRLEAPHRLRREARDRGAPRRGPTCSSVEIATTRSKRPRSARSSTSRLRIPGACSYLSTTRCSCSR